MVVGLFVIASGGPAVADVAPRRAPVAQNRTAVAPKAALPKKLGATLSKEAAVPAPTATAVMMSYQRIGRDIIQLQSFRGTECTLELWKTFRAIKLDDATATTASRIATAATLQELSVKIDRRRGITIPHECLDNPLTAECQ